MISIASPGTAQPPRRLLADARGTTLVEFGMVAPVLGLLLVGAFDIGHTLYMGAVLQGAVQKTARDSGLESGLLSTRQATLDARVRSQVRRLAKSADVQITRRSYRSFSKAAAAQAEPLTDTNGNGRCDNGEPFEDQNGNGVRDTDGGNSGQGGAKDSVLYTVVVTYKRLLPLDKFLGFPPNVTVKATTIMNNQPYGDQGTDVAKVGTCPML